MCPRLATKWHPLSFCLSITQTPFACEGTQGAVPKGTKEKNSGIGADQIVKRLKKKPMDQSDTEMRLLYSTAHKIPDIQLFQSVLLMSDFAPCYSKGPLLICKLIPPDSVEMPHSHCSSCLSVHLYLQGHRLKS